MTDGLDWLAGIPDDLKLAQEIYIESPYVTGRFVVDAIEEDTRPDGSTVTSYRLVMLDPPAW